MPGSHAPAKLEAKRKHTCITQQAFWVRQTGYALGYRCMPWATCSSTPSWSRHSSGAKPFGSLAEKTRNTPSTSHSKSLHNALPASLHLLLCQRKLADTTPFSAALEDPAGEGQNEGPCVVTHLLITAVQHQCHVQEGTMHVGGQESLVTPATFTDFSSCLKADQPPPACTVL